MERRQERRTGRHERREVRRSYNYRNGHIYNDLMESPKLAE